MNSIVAVLILALATCHAQSSVGCGRQASAFAPRVQQTSRIIGGSEAKPHSWPWMVTFSVDMGNGMGSICGSSLLRVKDNAESSDIILTAAHCVTKPETMGTNPQAISSHQVTAIAGNHRHDRVEAGEERRRASVIRFHPNFRFTEQAGANNDVALVKLEKPIRFSDTIRPVCLPKAGEALPVGKTCVAAGWGRNNSRNEQDMPIALQQVLAPAHDVNTCRRGWGATYKEDQMICAGSLKGDSGACQGDSGGMLACQQSDGSSALFGATSFGLGGPCVSPGQPGNFARISSYVPWIVKNMQEMTSV